MLYHTYILSPLQRNVACNLWFRFQECLKNLVNDKDVYCVAVLLSIKRHIMEVIRRQLILPKHIH